MRILFKASRRIGDTDAIEHRQRFRFRRPAVQPLIAHQNFAHLAANGQHRIQRRHRVLENHRNLTAANPPHLLRRFLRQVIAAKANAAAGNFAIIAQQLENRFTGDALTASGFSDNADQFPGVQRKTDATHRVYFTLTGEEGCVQVFKFQQVTHRGWLPVQRRYGKRRPAR